MEKISINIARILRKALSICIKLYQNGKTQTQLCAEYGFFSSALSRWIKAYSQVKIDENTVMTAKQVVMETMEAAYIQRGCTDGVVFYSDRG